MMRKIMFLLFVSWCVSGSGQTIKQEIRGNWLATVYRLNWPPSYAVIEYPGDQTNITKQKNAMISMLDSFVKTNQNVVFFQVRSRCDAMYKSSYEPWSADLVATRGMDPKYDPLQFVIDEGHKRGLEIHAWVNPYRFESVAGQWSGMEGDYATSHPDWIIQVGNATILNPGKPEVRNRITAIIEEIVSGYDVDGIIFDDYFYLQGIKDEDIAEQKKYNTEGLSVGDWRRQNVNKMIAQVYQAIQKIKPYVRFGVSPAGIWGGSSAAANKYGVTPPVGIGSGYAYNGIYCDPLAWLSEGTIDYISPQIYWPTGSGSTDYTVLSEWWSNIGQQFSRHFYSSQSISALDPWNAPARRSVRIGNQEVEVDALSGIERQIASDETDVQTRATNSFGYAEVGRQIDCNRLYDKNSAPGTVFYSAKKFLETKGFMEYLQTNHFRYKALPPAIFWKSGITDKIVDNLVFSSGKLTWNAIAGDYRYSVYAMPLSEPVGNMGDASYLLGMSYSTEFTVPTEITASTHRLGVAVLDRYGNESPIRIVDQPLGALAAVSLNTPVDGATVILPTTLKWNTIAEAASYQVEIAQNTGFTNLVACREVTGDFLKSSDLFPLERDKTYYWRVKAQAPGKTSSYSETREMRTFAFSILSPSSGSENISLTPLIKWTAWSDADKNILEIATTQEFGNSIVYTCEESGPSHQMPDEVLIANKTYYMRVRATSGERTLETPVCVIRTVNLEPTVPQILAPAHESYLLPGKVRIAVDKNPNASGFRYELSNYENFPPRATNIQIAEAFNYQIDCELDEGTYYVRVRATYGTTYTPWSNVVKFIVSKESGLADVDDGRKPYISCEEHTHFLYLPYSSHPFSIIRLFNENGKLLTVFPSIRAIPTGSDRMDLHTGELPAGTYIVVYGSGEKVHYLKFIK